MHSFCRQHQAIWYASSAAIDNKNGDASGSLPLNLLLFLVHHQALHYAAFFSYEDVLRVSSHTELGISLIVIQRPAL
jgi:hypothetical protein